MKALIQPLGYMKYSEQGFPWLSSEHTRLFDKRLATLRYIAANQYKKLVINTAKSINKNIFTSGVAIFVCRPLLQYFPPDEACAVWKT